MEIAVVLKSAYYKVHSTLKIFSKKELFNNRETERYDLTANMH